jgi:hypothetical protein
MRSNSPMQQQKSSARQAFGHYLRTGQRLPERAFERAPALAEFKFNPYHDPRDGRFTFATGGVRSTGASVARDRQRPANRVEDRPRPSKPLTPTPRAFPADGPLTPKMPAGGFDDGVYRPQGGNATLLKPVAAEARARARSNYDALIRPMTLQPVFPGLQGAAAGAIVAMADDFMAVTSPARDLTVELTRDRTNVLINEIRKIDPDYRLDSLGFPRTPEGMANQLNALQRDRAAALYRMRGEMEPLQVETLRYLQTKVDKAYEEGMLMLRAGKLNVRLSPNEAVGNFVDRAGRESLRELYRWLRISTKRGEQVRVIGREYETRETDRTYRIPDSRVGKIAFDMTLTRKTLATAQVRGFFSSDFSPEAVVIVRPSQLGPNSTYIITRPGN